MCESAQDMIKLLNIEQLNYRLEAPVQSKDYLRFFCKIKSYGTHEFTGMAGEIVRKEIILPNMTINCSDVQLENGHYKIIFDTPPSKSVLWWNGECNIKSEIELYAVDRHAPGNIINQKNEWQNLRMMEYTTLSKKQYKEIGRVARNEPNYYIIDNPGRSYDFDTGHSAQRNGMIQRSIITSSSRTQYKSVSVDALKQVYFSINIKTIHKLFLKPENEKNKNKKQKK